MDPDQLPPALPGRFAARKRQCGKVLRAYRNMTNLIIENALQDGCTMFISLVPDTREDGRRDVKAARFQHHGYDGKPR